MTKIMHPAKPFLLVMFCILLSFQGFAQNSLIDQTFGSNGKFMPRYDKAPSYFEDLQMDGKNRMMFVNSLRFENGDEYIEMVRYDANGQLDNSFSGDGKLTINLSTDVSVSEYSLNLAFTSDHKIFFIHNLDGNNQSIIKLNENGSFDNSFGTNGRLMIDASFDGYGSELVVTAENKPIVVGEVYNEVNDIQSIKLIRYNTNGTPDASFGVAGEVLINNQLLSTPFAYLDRTTIHANGKITLFGEPETEGLLAIQLADNGTRNNQFANTGQLVYAPASNLGNSFYFYSFLIDKNGNFLLSGIDDSTSSIVARITENGNLDNTFGTSGKIEFEYNNSNRINYTAIPSKKTGIWLGGAVKTQSRYRYSLGKLNENGTLDNSFGNAGYLTLAPSEQDAFGFIAYEQSDDKVILFGFSHDAAGYAAIKCLRVQNTGQIDNSYGIAGVVSITQVQQKPNEELYSDATILRDMKVLSDDGILHTGTFSGGGIFPDENGIYIAKQLANGSPDPLFGNNGFIAISPMFGENTSDERSGKIAVGNNKILTAYPIYDFFSGNTILLSQHTATGQPDASFGDNGRKLFSPAPNANDDFIIHALEFLPNGKVAILITFFNTAEEEVRTEIVQMLANGNLDDSFSGDGKYTLPFDGGDFPFYASHLKFTTDNKIVVVGMKDTPGGKRLAVLRLTNGGIPDNTFNSGIPVIIGYSAELDIPAGMIIESNNDITIGFTPFNSDKEFGIVKLNANGTPSAGWGTNGVLVSDLPDVKRWQHFIRKENGAYLLIGANPDFDRNVVSVLNLSSTGAIDATYGTNGIGLITFEDVWEYKLMAISLQQNGKLIISGNEFILFDNMDFVNRDFASMVRISTGAATGPVIYTMTQPGNWSNAANWQSGQAPPDIISANMEVIINPGGSGISVLDIPVTVQQGGKITVNPGKTFQVQANLTVPAITTN